MLAPGRRARRGVHVVITVAAVATAAVAGTAVPATAAPAAAQSVQPGPPAVFGWGVNDYGQVGDGTTTPRATPVPVLGLPSVHGRQVTVKQVVCGNLSGSCAVLLADGTVHGWGRNGFGEVGDGTTTQRLTPVLVPNLSGITQIAQGVAIRWPWEPVVSSGPGVPTRTGNWGTPKSREDIREIAELTSDDQLLRIAELPEVPVSLEHLRQANPANPHRRWLSARGHPGRESTAAPQASTSA